MAYCVAADVKVYVGTLVSDGDLTAMIADSDAEISQYFVSRGGLSPSSTAAKSASVLLTRARVAERFQLTGENPTGYSSGDYSQSGSVDTLGQSKLLREAALGILQSEAGRLGSNYSDSASITRCDAVVDDFKLDQSDMPEMFSELT